MVFVAKLGVLNLQDCHNEGICEYIYTCLDQMPFMYV
jgi:hypothetical protein